MKNRKLIITGLLVLAVIIVGLVITEVRQSRPENRSGNPYEYEIDEFGSVDSTLIDYEETLNFTFGDPELRAIAAAGDRLFLAEDNYLVIFTPAGEKLVKRGLPASPTCIAASGEAIYIGFTDYIIQYNTAGEPVKSWAPLNDSAHLTSLAIADSFLFAADAGNRKVLRYKLNGEPDGEFAGRRNSEDLHGFIIPSPYFELAINGFGELWVVNPGRHAFENYTFDGQLRGYWEKTDISIDGFSGCCNPAQMAVMPDGSFVTAEKGLVRIKIHKASGELLSVVAPPESFPGATKAPDLAVGSSGIIYAIDYEQNVIRVFQKKSKP